MDYLLTVLRPRQPPLELAGRRAASRRIRFQVWFNTYRKLFILVVSINITGILYAVIRKRGHPRESYILGNLLMSILMRSELSGRVLHLIVNTCFAKWPPLWFRLACTSILQHRGGIHSGCGISGWLWLLFRVVLIFIDHADYHISILVMGLTTTVVVGTSMASAFSWVRDTHHNVFERFHRFVGWIGLVFTWVFVVLGDTYDSNTHSWNRNGVRFIRTPDFWLVLAMTVSVIVPWCTVRAVKVSAEIPSTKVVILRFERGMQRGLFSRISRTATLEYHAFGIISEGVHSKEHYLICGVKGDFTRKLGDDPPQYIWTRELKFPGISHSTVIYKRGIEVCTGTGLGSALSTCLQSPDWYLLWIGSDQEKTYGPTIAGLIHRNLGPDRLTLWDTTKQGGRPDTMKLIKEICVSWRAEVVFITSNYEGTQEMMERCKEAGIPAFGTLWDF